MSNRLKYKFVPWVNSAIYYQIEEILQSEKMNALFVGDKSQAEIGVCAAEIINSWIETLGGDSLTGARVSVESDLVDGELILFVSVLK